MRGVLIPQLKSEKRVLSEITETGAGSSQESNLIDYSVKSNELSNF